MLNKSLATRNKAKGHAEVSSTDAVVGRYGRKGSRAEILAIKTRHVDGADETAIASSRSAAKTGNDYDEIMVPQPKRALIGKHEQVVYQAAWYHFLLPSSEQTEYCSSWRNKCKIDWNRSFWQLAQNDETLLEMFISFAAAKEASMKRDQLSRLYFLHKGRAMTLVSKDILREGQQLRLPAVAAICLLCMAAFVEGDYEAAQTHLQAVVTLVSKTLADDRLPSFLWLLLTWADLRLTAINSHKPLLPYVLHPEFNVRLPPFLEMRAQALAELHAKNLPVIIAFQNEHAVELLRNLYVYTAVHSYQDMDWKVAWSVSYQVAFSLANLQDRLEQIARVDDPENHDRVCAFLIAARILFWFTMSTFITQGGLQTHLLKQLMKLLSGHMPAELCYQWARRASLDALLWTLFAVYTSLDGVGIPLSEPEMNWLRASMKMVVRRLKLNSYDSFAACLRRMPFAVVWTNLTCTAYAWLDGSPLVTDFEPHPSSIFASIRLNFDPMQEVDRLSGHYSLKEIDSLSDTEPRCTACRDKVSWSSEQLFHFTSLRPP